MRHTLLSFACALGMVAGVALRTEIKPALAAEAGGSDTLPSLAGTVVETMNAGTYTYALVDDGAKKVWVAGPQTAVAVGDKVTLADGAAMRDFHSKTLDRTFDVVYFVSAIQVVGGAAPKGDAAAHAAPHAGKAAGLADQAASAHGAMGAKPAAVDLSNIKKADGGQTVAELYTNKAKLVGQDVVVRGRVVKFTAAVMDKNWLHLQDGSGVAGSNDLTVSTSGTAAVGDTVLVRGKLGADKDLGFGYHYDIIIEDGAVTVE